MNKTKIILSLALTLPILLGAKSTGDVEIAYMESDLITSNISNCEVVDKQEIVEVKEDLKANIYRNYIPLNRNLQEYIVELCDRYDVDINLVYAVIKVESDFNSSLISGTDDYGLMQINTVNHNDLRVKLGITDFLNPYENVNAGIYLLSTLNKYDLHKQLMAYNMGVGGMTRVVNNGHTSSKYSRKVVEVMKEYERININN